MSEEVKEKHGIKEVKEALVAVNEITIFLVTRFRDGIGLGDGLAIYNKIVNDEEFKGLILEAVDGWKKIPIEIADLSLTEGFELAKIQLGYIPRIIGAFTGNKKKKDEIEEKKESLPDPF